MRDKYKKQEEEKEQWLQNERRKRQDKTIVTEVKARRAFTPTEQDILWTHFRDAQCTPSGYKVKVTSVTYYCLLLIMK